jgi:catechol 2,3-dioxygenase-like lactoylglutathione lyase family enzyme
MKRFHVHLSVDDLSKNIRFYSALFGTAPTVEKTDYAKWMLDDPHINFAISQRGGDIPMFGEHGDVDVPAIGGCCVPESPVSFEPRPNAKSCCG